MTVVAALAVPVVVAVITAVITSVLTTKKDIRMKTEESRRARYEALLTALSRGFFGSHLPDAEKASNKAAFFEQSYLVWLYGSDEVINQMNAFSSAITAFANERSPENEKRVRAAFGLLVETMRKDTMGATTLDASKFLSGSVNPVP